MISRISDMPPGTLGFVLTGDVTREDYRQVLLPPLREAVERGDRLRLLIQIGPGFDEFEPGAVLEDLRIEWSLGIRHHHAWERTAIVTDDEWIARGAGMFAWMVPGQVRILPLEEAGEARAWLAGQ
jgi:SpoIIAA-like